MNLSWARTRALQAWQSGHSQSALYKSGSIRQLEALVRQAGPGLDLMERAGRAAFDWVQQLHSSDRPLVIFCGAGNNGGDGLVLARLARLAGYWVEVRICGDWQQLPQDAERARQKFTAEGGQLLPWDAPWPVIEPGLIVDALLGLGGRGPLRAPYAQAVALINAAHCPVLALDVPSGLQADTGEGGLKVQAEYCLSFLAWKTGLFSGKAAECVGELRLADLGLTELTAQLPPDCFRVELAQFKSALLPRPRDAHKGKYGQVLVIGGAPGMGGAALLAAEAALKTGAGKVALVTDPAHLGAALARCPELMVHGIGAHQVEDLQPLLAKASHLVLGPGLGQTAWSEALFAQAWFSELPLILDADGLNLLSRIDAPEREAPLLLTPHPAEAARLLQCSTQEVNRDRSGAAQQLAEQYRAQVVLKGAGSLIALPGASLRLAQVGNPGMASAGMGDVLAGILGGLAAQAVAWQDLACLGVCLHGAAADCAAEQGERGLHASRLFDWLPLLLNPVQLEAARHA